MGMKLNFWGKENRVSDNRDTLLNDELSLPT